MRDRVLALIIKEFQAVWRDRRTRMILLVPPLIQMILFGYVATLEVTNVTLCILNHDAGAAGRELSHRLCGATVFGHVRFAETEQDLRRDIDSRTALVGVVIPRDFSRTGGRAALQLILDGRRSNSAQIAAGYVSSIVDRWRRDADPAAPSRPQAVSRTWFNENRTYQWFTVPGLIGILMALEVLLLTGLSVARERELGTFDQVLVSPLSPGEIIVGKAVPSLLIGLGEGTLALMAAILVFQIPFRGSIVLLYGGMALFLLAMIGVGLFVSALAQTQQQALLGTFVVFMPIVLLSGFMTPVENMPPWLQVATAWNPLRYFLIIVKGVFLKDMTSTMVAWHAVPLVLIAAVTLAAANRLFRARLG